jgi:hypothetical protein
MKNLIKLKKWLIKNNYHKISQEIKDLEEYAEPWHQEVIEELNKKDEESLKNLEDKFKSSPKDLKESLDEFYKNVDQSYVRVTNDIEIEIIHNILEKENFKPLYLNANLVAGKGTYGLVLKGVYQGNQAVIKIEIGLQDRPPDREINNWEKILNVKNMMPNDLRKHIPNIYKLNSGVIDKELLKHSYRDVYYTVIIMEELFKISKDMDEFLNGFSKRFIGQMVNQILDNPELIVEVSKKIYDELNGDNRPSDFNINNIFKIIYTNLENASNLHKLITKIVSNIFNLLDPNNKISDRNMLVLRGSIRDEIGKLLNNFPSDEEYHSLIWEKIPETKTLMEALKFLKQNTGLSWFDQHTGNIMMDRDGNLKIIDVGLWKNTSI